MLKELAKLLEEPRKTHPWLGKAHCVRCFLHVVNLIAQTLLWQFDSPRQKGGVGGDGNGGGGSDGEPSEQKEQHKIEDAILHDGNNELGPDEDDNVLIVEDDDASGWVDELEEMGQWERGMHSQDIAPLRLALAKV